MIPDDKVAEFEKAFPDARVDMYDGEGARYSIPIGRQQEFKESHEGWNYDGTSPLERVAESAERMAGRAIGKEDGETWGEWLNRGVERARKAEAERQRDGLAEGARLVAQGEAALRELAGQTQAMRDYYSAPQGALGRGQTAQGGLVATPEGLRREYLSPTGIKTTDKAMADAASRQYRSAADVTVAGQLRRANRRLEELRQKAVERARELDAENDAQFEGASGMFSGLGRAKALEAKYATDQTYNALNLAVRQTEEQIKTLQEQKDRESGVDVGFWRGAGRVMGDPATWDMGISDLRDARIMLNAANGAESAEEAEANQAMMEAIHGNQQAEQAYGGDFWYRAGVMAGYMPTFMLDFLATGGGYGGVNIAGKAATRLATKAVGKEVAEQITRQGFKKFVKDSGIKGLGQYAGNWAVKALGTTADDLLIRAPLMTNTVQAGGTAADVIDRKLGDVVVRMDGSYDFANDKTWGEAAWQGEANAIIENYSEMFGGHLGSLPSLRSMGELAGTFGARRLGALLAKADAGAFGRIMGQTQRLFNKMGVSDYAGEVSEELYGQPWRTMLGLDDAYTVDKEGNRVNLLATGEFYGDVLGGMALSMGMIGAAKYGITGAQYAHAKHQVNKADARAAEILGKDTWDGMRMLIDNTRNDGMGALAAQVAADPEMADEEKAAVLDYVWRSMAMRGYNLVSVAEGRGGEPRDMNAQQAEEAYMNGYNASGAEEMQDVRNMMLLQRERIAAMLPEEAVADIERDPAGALAKLGDDEAVNQAVVDYACSLQAYNGLIQRMRDEIDKAVERNNARIDRITNRSTGKIHQVRLKLQNEDGSERYACVTEGNIVPLPDGTGVDREKSDRSVVVRYLDGSDGEMVPVEAVMEVMPPRDPDADKLSGAQDIRTDIEENAAAMIEGKARFWQGETYTVAAEDGSQAQVTVTPDEQGVIDNGDGTVNVADGSGKVVPMSKEFIQAQVDAQNRARVERKLGWADETSETDETNGSNKPNMAYGSDVTGTEADVPELRTEYIVEFADAGGGLHRGEINDINTVDKYVLVDEDTPEGVFVRQYPLAEFPSMLRKVADEDGQVLWQAAQPATSSMAADRHTEESGNGESQFVKTSDGNVDFGIVNQSQAASMGTNVVAPIRLSVGNEGYGLTHMEKHLEEIKKNGYNTIEEFVEDVSRNYDEIRQGNIYTDRAGKATRL